MIPQVAHPYLLFALGAVLTFVAYLWRRSEAADRADRDAIRADVASARTEIQQVKTDLDATEGEVLAEVGRVKERLTDHDSRLHERFVTRVEWQATNARLDRIDDKLDRLLERTA